MLTNQPTIGFVATSDLERARAFYEDVLGLELVDDDGFALVFGSEGRVVRVVAVEELNPQPFTVLGWAIPDAELGAAVAELAGRGVTFLRFEALDQDEGGIWTAPSGDRVAWLADPDGNVLSLSSQATR